MPDPRGGSSNPDAASGSPGGAQAGDARPGDRAAGAEAGDGSSDSGLIVGVGASAGGLEAFTELLTHLPATTGMAFVVVQHLDPHHESILPDLLRKCTSMPVLQVHGHVPVQSDHVYVIPPNATMVIAGRVLQVTPAAPSPGHPRRAIDAFFTSLAEDIHGQAIGVVLSGTASDGTLGLKAIKAEGGITFAQDGTAKFDGMPRSAVAAGFVDFVLSPRRIAQELSGLAQHRLTVTGRPDLLDRADLVEKVFALLRRSTGVDFSEYKPATIHRRLARRMMVQRVEGLPKYIELLQTDPREVAALYDDLLIKVTEFFRDPAVFHSLNERVFPAIVKHTNGEDILRIWVPGCSTGEEVYSLAIAVIEYLEREQVSRKIQIFATDASETVIETARAGVYGEGGVTGVSGERLRRFFTQVDSGYQINRSVRDICIFSRHNLATDPALSHMHLVSCRNLLIYFGSALQQRVLGTLAYALRPDGCLVLGSAENSETVVELFDPVDEENRIYSRKPILGAQASHRTNRRPGELETVPVAWPVRGSDVPRPGSGVVNVSPNYIRLSRFGPTGMIVDSELRVVEVTGEPEKFGLASAGKDNAPRTLDETVGAELAGQLREAIDEAHRYHLTVRLDEMQIRHDRGAYFVRVTVVPVGPPGAEPCSVVLFHDVGNTASLAAVRARDVPPAAAPGMEDPEGRVMHLEQELASNREYLQSIIEELRSMNEEAQSANEELQSSNEQLQTTQEELQASNEELSTLNSEMQSRNLQLSRANDDLANLLSSISAPIVMVGNDLRIRRFTPAAEKILRLIPGDAGRPISDLKPRIDGTSLEEVFHGVLETLSVHEQEVVDGEGRGYLMRVRPYRTGDNRIEGAVLLLVDITELRRSMEEVRRARDYAGAIIDTVREPLLVLDGSLRVRSANRSFYLFFRIGPELTVGRSFYDIGNRDLDLPPVRQLLERLRAGEQQVHDVEIEHDFQHIGRRTILLNARRLEGGDAGSVLLAFEDVTERKRELEARYRRVFESARDGILILDAATSEITDLNPYAERLFGYPREELVGRKLWETPVAGLAPQLRTALEQQVRDFGVVRFPDLEFKTREGRTILTEAIASVYSEGDRRAVQFNVRDLTERRKFERELQHSQKLESLGLLAGGVAHDFNNLLTGILGNASLAYANAGHNDRLRPRLREIITAAEHAGDLTRQLLAYAGKGRFVIAPVNLSELVGEILTLVQTSITKNVQLILDLPAEIPAVEADPAQIQQLVMNLAINAAEAIGAERPGTVEIRTGVRELSTVEVEEQFAGDGLSPGEYVSLQVKDSGAGMDEATKARIFDPFFTTKFTGRGLGLAAASGIIRALRGAIRVYSTPAVGTTFYILLPAAPRPKQVARPKPPSAARGGGTVLVVDDEPPVRNVAQAILEHHGFEVLSAEDGRAAVDMFRRNAGRVSLVIMDLTMPVMDGEQAFDLIRAADPGIPILLASGYDEAETAARNPGRDFAGFLHKPFDVEGLLQAVAAALKTRKQEPKG